VEPPTKPAAAEALPVPTPVALPAAPPVAAPAPSPVAAPKKEDVAPPPPAAEAPTAGASTADGGTPTSAADVATTLMTMGFEPKSVELVLEKHLGVEPESNLLEACTRELVQLSEWDSMLSDLEEMGFDDREKNTRLMIKNDGSVKRTVKDLVSM